MKITAVKTYLMHAGSPRRYALPRGKTADTPEAFGGTRNWLFVRIETDEGISGIGECSGWPRVVEMAVQELSTLLIGEDPGNIERLWQKMMTALMGHGMTGTVGGGAMSGLDMALWDIKGKALGVPVWSLLGGKLRDRIRIYAHANSADAARDLTARGITALKCGGVGHPVRTIEALREAVGETVDLMVDLHGPPWLTPSDAVGVARALEPYNLLFLEDPISPDNLEGYRRLRDQTALPLAAGERMTSIWGLRPLIEEGLVDVVQPDTGRAGGLSQMRKVAAMAEASHIMVAPHSGSLGPVAEYAALHLMASIPNALILERIEDDWEGRANTVIPHPVQQDGFLAVPDAPGLGVEIDEEFVAKHPSRGNLAVPVGPASPDYLPGTFTEHVYVQTRLGRDAWLKGR